MLKITFLAVSALMFVSCEKSSEKEANAMNASSKTAALDVTASNSGAPTSRYVSRCETRGTRWSTDEYSISGNTLTRTYLSYTDPQCTAPNLWDSSRHEFSVSLEPVTGEQDVYLMPIVKKKITVAMFNASDVETANKTARLGFNDWTPGSYRDITSIAAASEDVNVQKKLIVKMNNETFCIGKPKAENPTETKDFDFTAECYNHK
jgi:hypothetical protein